MRDTIKEYEAVKEAAMKFVKSVAEGNSKYAKELFTEEAVLFGYLDGYGWGFGVLGFDRRFWIGTRTGSRSGYIWFSSTTGHKEYGHQERSGQGLEDIQDSE